MPNIAAAAVAVTALVGVLAALSLLAALPRQLDLADARSYRLTGVVTQVRYSQAAYEPRAAWTHPPLRMVLLSVDGQDLDVSAPIRNVGPRLKVGEAVDVTYRRGKSGIRYVDEVELLRDHDR